MISCMISGLDSAADVTWIDPEGERILDGFSAVYVVDEGKSSFHAGAQASTLVIRAAQVALIDSAKTYKCSFISAIDPDSVIAEKSITLNTALGNCLTELLWLKLIVDLF